MFFRKYEWSVDDADDCCSFQYNRTKNGMKNIVKSAGYTGRDVCKYEQIVLKKNEFFK